MRMEARSCASVATKARCRAAGRAPLWWRGRGLKASWPWWPWAGKSGREDGAALAGRGRGQGRRPVGVLIAMDQRFVRGGESYRWRRSFGSCRSARGGHPMCLLSGNFKKGEARCGHRCAPLNRGTGVGRVWGMAMWVSVVSGHWCPTRLTSRLMEKMSRVRASKGETR
jgi:hypothetical protein